jgi:hypothetical protein
LSPITHTPVMQPDATRQVLQAPELPTSLLAVAEVHVVVVPVWYVPVGTTTTSHCYPSGPSIQLQHSIICCVKMA